MRNENDFDQGSSHKDGENWMNSGYILNLELKERREETWDQASRWLVSGTENKIR